jgi:hypothetical protein
VRGRYLQLLSPETVNKGIEVRLWEDGYQAWLPRENLGEIEVKETPYPAIYLSRSDIEKRLPDVIAFTQAAREKPNYYLWGGTLGPNYDCSGLIQAAFAASGIWLPRDSYQQEAFTEKISLEEIIPGDLIFFAERKVNHVALYLGNGSYIHSSGKETGRNGIGIDYLSEDGDEISRFYYQKFWSCGRVMTNYRFQD